MTDQNNQTPADPGQQAAPALNPDLVGYQNEQQLAQAHRNLMAEAKKRSEENQAMAAEIQRLQFQQQFNPRQDVPQRNTPATPADRLTEFGIPVDALDQYVSTKLNEAFQPVLGAVNARNTLLGKYPDYNRFESDVANHIQADPQLSQRYQKMFSADPVGAMEWAFDRFGESRRGTHAQGDDIRSEVMSHAAIPGSRNGDSRRSGFSQHNDAQKAWEEYQRTGSADAARKFAHARLSTAIPDEFLNQ